MTAEDALDQIAKLINPGMIEKPYPADVVLWAEMMVEEIRQTNEMLVQSQCAPHYDPESL